jgi:amino acid adenylation domain-containing protein
MLDDKSSASVRVGPAPGNGQAVSPDTGNNSGLAPADEEGTEKSLAERFEKIVRLYPHRLAVKAGNRSLTYEALNRAANRIAHAILAKRGAGNEPVALLFEQGIDVIIAIFAVLKAGKFYVALDASFPEERMNHILEDSGSQVILSNPHKWNLARQLSRGGRVLLRCDEIDDSHSPENPGIVITATDFALMTYTSGSTGKPKGMAREQLKYLYRTKLKTREVPIHPTDKLSLIHSVAFGSANNNLFQSLLNGASLFPFDVKSEGIIRLAKWLAEERITIFHSPPAIFRPLAESLSGAKELPSLRLIRLSGSATTRQDYELYRKKFSPGTSLEIHMGSTEAGAIARAIVDHSFAFPEEGVPVGYPARGKKILLLDEDGREALPGERGEIAVKSRHLNLGYWKQPELTGAKFLPDPEGGDERIFLTGDLGRMLPDGLLIHLGRKDFMVKIRGYRVELSEIEKKLVSHAEIKEAAVVALDRDEGEKYLAAYVVSRGNPPPNISELRDFLGGTLPGYMLPSAFVFLESLPLTNGKLDRKALPPPDRARPDMRRPYIPPQSALERKLVRIWEEVLDVRPIGIHDDFFDLGGHSLMGASLMAQVQRDFQVDLPLKLLFQCPTVAKLALCVEEIGGKPKPSCSYLVELQSGDPGRAPIFFFPGGGGSEPEFFLYARIARHVGLDYSFYGLRAPGTDGTSQPHRRVEDMAAAYIREIKTVQPHGPYFLVGECFGGVVAHEVARQLQDQKERIALLALMDTQRPTRQMYLQHLIHPWVKPVLGNYYVQRIPFHWKTLCQLDHREKIPFLFDKLGNAFVPSPSLPRPQESVRSRAKAIVELNTDRRMVKRIDRRRERYRRALRRHNPKPYGGGIQILVNEKFYRRNPTLGWDQLALGGLEIHKLPGDHDSYIREHVQAAAKKLRECLEKAGMEARL